MFPGQPSLQNRVLTAGLMTLVLGLPAASETPGQDKTGPNLVLTTPAATPRNEGAAAVERLALGYELFALGRAQGDALTVLVAARLVASSGVAPAGEGTGREMKKTEAEAGEEEAQDAELTVAPATPEPAGDLAEGQTGASPDAAALLAPPDADAIFALALELAGPDEFMAGVILDARDAAARGRIGGAWSQSSSLAGGRTDSWEIAFTGGSYAGLAVVGNGSSDLDIVVTDENGNVICFEGGPEASLYCDFVPSWDGFFYVAIENSGGNPTVYDLITN